MGIIRTIYINNPYLLSKFRGCLLGGLLGDCYGAPFEGEELEAGDLITLRKYFDKLEGPMFKAPVKQYTDDTAMTKSVAKCLINHKDLPNKELAKSFVKEYYKEPKRGYSGVIISVFEKLRQSKLSDPLKPAKEQFEGFGSHGNGAAMRVAPVGLFCHNKKDKLIELVTKSAMVTHTHKLGINGAILQALSVNMCVNLKPSAFNKNKFVDELINHFKDIETHEEGPGIDTETSYINQLKQIKILLNTSEFPSKEEVLNILGHSVAALYSVPTALYCFLVAHENIENIRMNNAFRRTIEYAISLGGDTDTIASMAGSLAGALCGHEIISDNLIKHCEANKDILNLADKLHQASK